MGVNRWGLWLAAVLLLGACDSPERQDAKPAPTTVESRPATVSATPGTSSCRPPEPRRADEAATTVFVYLLCGGDNFPEQKDLFAVPRRIPSTKAVLKGALTELLKGATAEERRNGFWSVFAEETASLLVDVKVTDDGVAIIDFSKELAEMGNVSATSTAEAIRLTLEATVHQFPNVEEAVYRLDGDRIAWCNLFELNCGDGGS